MAFKVLNWQYLQIFAGIINVNRKLVLQTLSMLRKWISYITVWHQSSISLVISALMFYSIDNSMRGIAKAAAANTLNK